MLLIRFYKTDTWYFIYIPVWQTTLGMITREENDLPLDGASEEKCIHYAT